jgi:putative transposase
VSNDCAARWVNKPSTASHAPASQTTAITHTGKVPEISNTDQGSQFTSAEWTGKLLDIDIKISMDGKGRWMDNIFIERLWRSVKHERIYLFEHATIPELRASLHQWFTLYNDWRPHQTHKNLTPSDIYQTPTPPLTPSIEKTTHNQAA